MNRADLANTLDGEGLYTLQFRAYLAANGVSLVGDVNTVWPGVTLAQSDFQSSQLILSGHGLEILSLWHTSRLSGSILIVR